MAAQGSRIDGSDDDLDGRRTPLSSVGSSSNVMSPSASTPSVSLASNSSSSSISSWGPGGGGGGASGWDARDNNSRDNFAVVIRARKCAPGTEVGVAISGNMITITRDGKPHQFSYDTVYGPETKQKDVYQEKARVIVGQALEGFNGTIFAYGQTGSGKTHTMMGDIHDPELRGITPSMVDHIFTHIQESNAANVPVEYTVSASFLEIYNEQVRDLFGSDTRANLDVRESPQGFVVPALTKREVRSRDALMKLIHDGFSLRATSATSQNVVSSRSHSLITIYIDKRFKSTTKSDDPNAPPPDDLLRPMVSAKLNLVDLAGSERMQDASAVNKETQNINKSLSCLANVISALTTPPKDPSKPPHIPYRDSKLTRLLKDSLGGNAKTLMIACLHPNAANARESLSTLRYASRAKMIKNTPKVNMGALDSALADMQTEIDHLNKLLQRKTELTVACCQLVHDLQRQFKLSGKAIEEKDEQSDIPATPRDGASDDTNVSSPIPRSTSIEGKSIVSGDSINNEIWRWLDRLVPPARPTVTKDGDADDDDDEDEAPPPEVPWLEPEVVERITRLRGDVKLVMKALTNAQKAARRAALGGFDSMSMGMGMIGLSMGTAGSTSSVASPMSSLMGGADDDDVAFAVQMRTRAEIGQLLNDMTMMIHDGVHQSEHDLLRTQLENVRRDLAMRREEWQIKQEEWQAKADEWNASRQEWRKTAKETAIEMNELNTLAESRATEITSLTDERDNARNEAATLTTQLERTRQRISSMGDELVSMRDELTKTTDTLNITRDQLSKITAEMTIVRGQLTRSNDEVTQTKTQLNKANEELTTTRTRLTTTTDDLTNVLQQLANEVSKHTVTRSELQQVNEKYDAEKVEHVRTRDDLYRINGDLTKTKEQLATVTSELSATRVEVATEQVNIAKAKEELQQIGEQFSSERLAHGRTRDELSGIQDDLAKKREQLTSTINDLADVRTHLATEKSDHIKTRTLLANVEERNEETSIQLKASISNNSDAEAILAKTRSELDSATTELEDVKHQLHQYRNEHVASTTKYATEMDRLVGNHRDRMEAHDSEVTRLREELARSKQQLVDAALSTKNMEAAHARQLADVEETSQAAVAAAIAAAAASAGKVATTPPAGGAAGHNGAGVRFQIHKQPNGGAAGASATTPTTPARLGSTGSNDSPDQAANGKTAAASEMGPSALAPLPRANGVVIDRAIESELRTLREALADVQDDVKAAQEENSRLNDERERLAAMIEDMERKGSSGTANGDGGASAETKEMAERLTLVLQQLEGREVELAELRGDTDIRISQLRSDFAARRAELQAELLSKRKVATKLERERRSLVHQTDALKMVVASKRAAGDLMQEKKLKRLEHTMQVERNRKELERSDLYGRIEVYRRKEFEWEKSNSAKDNEIRTLSRRSTRQQQDLQRLEKQVDDMQTRLTTTMDAAQKREDDWNKAWSEKEQAMAALQARIQIANMERDKAAAYMARYGPGRGDKPPVSSAAIMTPTSRPSTALSTSTSSGRRGSLDSTNGTSTAFVSTNGAPLTSPSSASSVRPDVFRVSSVRSPQQTNNTLPTSMTSPTTPTTISFDNNSHTPGSSIRPPRIFVSTAPPTSK